MKPYIVYSQYRDVPRMIMGENVQNNVNHFNQGKPPTPRNDQMNQIIKAVIANEFGGSTEEGENESRWASVGIPGLDRALDKERKMCNRFFWALIMVACLSICTYQIFTRVWLFLQYPVGATINIVKSSTVKFPQITICAAETETLLQLKREYVANTSREQKDESSVSLGELVGFNGLSAQDIWEKSKLPEFAQLLLQETEGKDETYAVDIKDKLTIHGLCKVINIQDDIRYFGMSTQLKIVMNSSNIIENDVLMVTIEMDDDPPDFKCAWYLRNGTETGISIKVKKFHKENTPANSCSEPTAAVTCLEKCINERLREGTNCKLPFMKRSTHEQCSTSENAIASYNAARDILHNITLAHCKCDHKCKNHIYESSREVFNLNSQQTIVSFYYSGNQIEIMEESEEYPLAAMLCDVGGNLGLYLGLSILSVIEIIEALNQVRV